MFTILYRWRIKPGLEQQFTNTWSEITEFYLKNFDSLGSRLHRGNDDIWYAYAQWRSSKHRENAFLSSSHLAAMKRMHDSIEESFPEIQLEIAADFLKSNK